MLGVLSELTANGCTGFSGACKAISECQSSLKGGELAGDLGWLDQAKGETKEPKGKAVVGAAVKPQVPTPVLRAAFELEVGELSDLIASDIGVHLLLRTA